MNIRPFREIKRKKTKEIKVESLRRGWHRSPLARACVYHATTARAPLYRKRAPNARHPKPICEDVQILCGIK